MEFKLDAKLIIAASLSLPSFNGNGSPLASTQLGVSLILTAAGVLPLLVAITVFGVVVPGVQLSGLTNASCVSILYVPVSNSFSNVSLLV